MTGIGNLYSVFLSWRGVTAGDRLVIIDGTTPAGSVIEEVILSNTNSDGISIPMPEVGKQFGSGLYIQPVLSGGEMNVSLGYEPNN